MTDVTTQKNKRIVWKYWQEINKSGLDGLQGLIQNFVHEDILWRGPYPINELRGAEALYTDYWQPLLRSFPDLQRRTDIFLGGHYEGKELVVATGYFTGTFINNWLGIPATGKETGIRFGEHTVLRSGKIVETFILLDILDVLRQGGYRFVPKWLNEEGNVPGPATGDGVLLSPQDDQESQKSLELMVDMLKNLAQYDGVDWSTQNKERFWHPNMVWYGPTGIGTVRGLVPFEVDYQTYFRRGLPDFHGIKLFTKIAEGRYSAIGGYPSSGGTHLGEFIGCPPTGKKVTLRVMDFYRREGNFLMENWVLIDMIYLALQMGNDIFADLRRQNN
ncbi:MAG: ester cyclase [Candidatus Promineifilaceae bacterium]|nr:ester cyclase [Candidatus Promineifilaceae bacterium]